MKVTFQTDVTNLTDLHQNKDYIIYYVMVRFNWYNIDTVKLVFRWITFTHTFPPSKRQKLLIKW